MMPFLFSDIWNFNRKYKIIFSCRLILQLHTNKYAFHWLSSYRVLNTYTTMMAAVFCFIAMDMYQKAQSHATFCYQHPGTLIPPHSVKLLYCMWCKYCIILLLYCYVTLYCPCTVILAKAHMCHAVTNKLIDIIILQLIYYYLLKCLWFHLTTVNPYIIAFGCLEIQLLTWHLGKPHREQMAAFCI